MSEEDDIARPLGLCLLGRPGSGKTTYLAAIWAVVTDSDAGALALRGPLPPATAYLDHAAHALRAGEAVDHTAYDTGESVSLALLLDRRPVDLDQLDVSGETLDAAQISRTFPRALHDRIAAAQGLLLFVHPDDLTRPLTIPEANRLAAAAGETTAPDDEPAPAEAPNDRQVFEQALTAVKLVDLLQVAAAAAVGPLPVAVVVSAWDIVLRHEPDATPRAWTERTMPLLAQYLANNSDRTPAEVFGVSAQGGDYTKQETAEALAQQPVAERAYAAGPDSARGDLGAPLRWLLARA